MIYRDNAKRWLNSEKVDRDTKAEIKKVLNNEEELKSRFGNMLSFGTAGLRGIIGAGLNRMNIYTVKLATQGLADLILDGGVEWMKRGVAIAYDCRTYSKEFARCAAEVMAGNGIKSYIFDELRPTPELSFAIRHLHTISGINVTASHNPKEYNGYKVYWEDGAQLPPHHAQSVSKAIDKRDIFDLPQPMPFDEGVEKGLIKIIGSEIDELYMENVLAQRVRRDIYTDYDFSVVYTPFHGAGYKMVPEVLRRAGVKNIITVPQQMVIDGTFPTVKSPNPEEKAGFALGIELAKSKNIYLIVGTDPDSDRLGIMVKDNNGEYTSLSGNQVGVLLLDYIIKGLKEQGNLPKNAYTIKTIVTTGMVDAVCKKNNIDFYSVFTGFKYIGEQIKKMEENGNNSFIFGFEESYGYLKGTYARDKDGVVAALLICEAACYYAKKGISLHDAMENLYKEYGYFADITLPIVFDGLLGQEQMTAVMDRMRATHLKDIAGFSVVGFRDYLYDFRFDVATKEKTPLSMSSTSNVLYFELEGDMSFIVRPSGTEPKIKCYILSQGKDKKTAQQRADLISKAAIKLLKV